MELNREFHLFPRAVDTVVDLAAAPGGFSQVALQSIDSSRRKGVQRFKGRVNRGSLGARNHANALTTPWRDPLVVAIDSRGMVPLKHVQVVQADVLDHDTVRRRVFEALSTQAAADRDAIELSRSKVSTNQENRVGEKAIPILTRKVQVVLHDGVSVVPGQSKYSVTYAQNHMALAALKLALSMYGVENTAKIPAQPSLRNLSANSPGLNTAGSSDHAMRSSNDPRSIAFVSKTLTSPHMDRLVDVCRVFFGRVHIYRPSATSEGSLEQYVVAQGLKLKQLAALEQGMMSGLDPLRSAQSKERRPIGSHLFSMAPRTEDVSSGNQVVWFCFGCMQRRFGAEGCQQCCNGGV